MKKICFSVYIILTVAAFCIIGCGNLPQNNKGTTLTDGGSDTSGGYWVKM